MFAAFLCVFWSIIFLLHWFIVFQVCVTWWLYHVWYGIKNICWHVIIFYLYPVGVFKLHSSVKWSKGSMNLCTACGSVGFWYLTSEVVFCWYRGGRHISICPCNYASHFSHPYPEASATLVIRSVSHLPSSHWTATDDHVGIKGIFLSVFSFDFGCLPLIAIRLLSSLSQNSGYLLNLGSLPVFGLLKKSVAWIGN